MQFNDVESTLALTLRQTAANLDQETVTLQDLLHLAGEQGLLLFCALLTLPFLLPVSIPGVSTVFGILIILIGIGVTLNRVPWLPRRLMERPMTRNTLCSMLEQGARVFDRLERWVKPRMSMMSSGVLVNRLNGFALTASGIMLLFPLSFVPFSNTLPAFSILFLAFGMLQRDGYVIIAGYIALIATLMYFGGLGLLLLIGGQTLLF